MITMTTDAALATRRYLRPHLIPHLMSLHPDRWAAIPEVVLNLMAPVIRELTDAKGRKWISIDAGPYEPTTIVQEIKG